MKLKTFIKKLWPCTYEKFVSESKNAINYIIEDNHKTRDELISALSSLSAQFELYNIKFENLQCSVNNQNEKIASLETSISYIKDDLKKIQQSNVKQQDLYVSLSSTTIQQFEDIKNTQQKIIDEQDLVKEASKSLTEYICEIRKNLDETNIIQAQNKRAISELNWAHVFNNTIPNSSWLLNKTFSPGRWAMGYLELYILYRVLDEFKPLSILELGLGQSTRMITQYVMTNSHIIHYVVEHDLQWIDFYKHNNALPHNTQIVHLDRTLSSYKDKNGIRTFEGFSETFKNQSFDLIIVDAPLGSDMKDYSRIDVLSILPKCLNHSFVIMLDDAERSGEINTAREINLTLTNAGISYKSVTYHGEKDMRVWVSDDWGFLCSL